MTPFLYKIARTFYSKLGNNLYKYTFVFPNRRAGIFFQKYLAEIAGKTIFSPQITTIDNFIEQLSSYQLLDRIELLIILYEHFISLSKTDESFDDFLYWGEMLLNDFNDVDKYMIEAKQLFINITDLKSIDDHAAYLTEEQIKAIRSFWKNFLPFDKSLSKQEFKETWQILHPLYNSFRKHLHDQGCAYEGMLYREVAEKTKDATLELPTDNIVFVGLHALSTSEIKILQHLQKNEKADFYWDYESPFVEDVANKASVWVTRNKLLFPSKYQLESSEQNDKINIEILGVPSGVGQAKQVTSILNKLIVEDNISNPTRAINTAIVLPDENLLLPILYSVPESIESINVTMGYSLSYSSISGLINHIAFAQSQVRMVDGIRHYYYRYVLSILNNSLVKIAIKDIGEELKEEILTHNKIVVAEPDLQKHPLLQVVFKPVITWHDLSLYLKDILSSIYGYLSHEKRDIDDNDEEEEVFHKSDAVESIDLEREFVIQYHKIITRLQDTLEDTHIKMSINTYFKLLDGLSASSTVSFKGEPLSGLQVMGILETRVLDFDNIILLSMNEGTFPLKKSSNSFVPYNLRKAFDMPTYEFQDSIYAYHFYRMISRARNVFLLYDTRSENMMSGEVSRYFYQIKYLYPDKFNIKEQLFTYHVKSPQAEPIVIEKRGNIWDKLSQFLSGGSRAMSASSFNDYIDCPLRFYFLHVEKLSEGEEVEESIEHAVYGSILHMIIQNIYERYKGKIVNRSTLEEIAKDEAYLTKMLEQAFAKIYNKNPDKPRPLRGNSFLVGETIKNYVKQVLRVDAKLTPFLYIDSELKFYENQRVNNDLSVAFKGSIDRVDEVKSTTRIIDYKTGGGKTSDLSFKAMQNLFDSSIDPRPREILQVFIYAYFYKMRNQTKVVSPEIYYMRKIFKDFSSTIIFDKENVNDITPYLNEFELLFNEKLAELFDKDIPFVQTDNIKNCVYCPFKEICQR